MKMITMVAGFLTILGLGRLYCEPQETAKIEWDPCKEIEQDNRECPRFVASELWADLDLAQTLINDADQCLNQIETKHGQEQAAPLRSLRKKIGDALGDLYAAKIIVKGWPKDKSGNEAPTLGIMQLQELHADNRKIYVHLEKKASQIQKKAQALGVPCALPERAREEARAKAKKSCVRVWVNAGFMVVHDIKCDASAKCGPACTREAHDLDINDELLEAPRQPAKKSAPAANKKKRSPGK
ncbi:MAG: hypothetical protein AAB091_02245 [Elusimicrobiota bacterium]